MNANLQSQLDGYQKYYDNLKVLREAVAEGIITPEFYESMASQGTSAANEVAHMAYTLEEQGDYGVEQLRGLSDKYMEALNWQDTIAQAIAGDQAALSGALASFGSSDKDFEDLQIAIDRGLAGADEEVKAQIENLAATAQSVGATIPQGLADAIASGEAVPTDVKEQLEASIQGALQGLLEIAQTDGGGISDELAQAITDGSMAPQEAYNALIDSIAEGTSSSTAIEESAKTAITDPIAVAISNGTEDVVTAAQTLTQTVAETLTSDTSAITTAGETAAKAFGDGMVAGSTSVATASQTVAEAAKTAMEGTAPAFTGVGLHMMTGMAQGIAAGSSAVINASVQNAVAALNAAKRALDIKSPSKRFKKEVGRQIGAGTAFGIKQSTAMTVAEASRMAAGTLVAATSWLDKYKKSHKVTKADEMYFWSEMANVTKAGTDAYNSIVSKAAATAASANFGVSRYTTTGSGKKKKRKKKSDETYYGDIYNAAQDYYDMLTMNQDMSVKAEMAYWQRVQASLKKGTNAYVSAAQKIKALQEQIGGIDVASDLLSGLEVYEEMSERALMEYWDRIRTKYAEGTEDRLKADKEYFNAKKRYNERLKDLEDEYLKDVQAANDRYAEALQDRTDAIATAFDLFEEFTSESKSGEELLFAMQSQAEGYQFWREQLEALGNRGILSEGLMSELSEKGPTEAAAVYALNTLSDDQLAAYTQAYQKKMDQARTQATSDTQKLADEVSAEIATLTENYNNSVSAVNQNLNSQIASLADNIRNIASDQTTQLVAALQAGKSAGEAMASANSSAGSEAAAPAAPATDQIAAIINSGKSRSKKLSAKEKKEHVPLWEYIATNYGRTATNAMYRKLAAALGIKVNNTPTYDQKNQILQALRKHGYRSGTQRLEDLFAWMDEAGIGSEMILRRSDGAALRTGLQKGDAIVPAESTQTLWAWSRINPNAFMTGLAEQQRALQAYVTQMAGSVNFGTMNDSLLASDRRITGGGSGQEMLAQMLDLMSQYMPYMAESNVLYLGQRDEKNLARRTAGYTGTELAARTRRRRG